jgi:hypothetical protein
VIAPSEYLARFLWQSNHFTSKGVKVKPFLPDPIHREVSVCRHGKEPDEQLWQIGQARVKKLYGAAMLNAGKVMDAGYEVSAMEPPDRHAVIRPPSTTESDPDKRDAEELSFAQKLASLADLHLILPASGQP